MSPSTQPGFRFDTLSSSLVYLLDAAGIHTRAEWARLLGVSNAAISQWVTGKTLPKPETLSLLWDLLEHYEAELTPGFARAFQQVLDSPCEKLPGGKPLSRYILEHHCATVTEALHRLPTTEGRQLVEVVRSALPPRVALQDLEPFRDRIRASGNMVLAALAQPLLAAKSGLDLSHVIDFHALVLALSETLGTRARAAIFKELREPALPAEWRQLRVLDEAMTALDRYFPPAR